VADKQCFFDCAVDAERADACLRVCLAELGSKQRDQIITYYGHDKTEKIRRRRELAERLGINQNALRVRMYRVRAVLEKCMKRCMESGKANRPIQEIFSLQSD